MPRHKKLRPCQSTLIPCTTNVMTSTEKSRIRANENAAAGLCRCGRERAPGKRRCTRCIDDDGKRRARNAAAGLCKCGREPVPGKRQCTRCIDAAGKRRARRTALGRKNAAAGLCRCGKERAPNRKMCVDCIESNMTRQKEVDAGYPIHPFGDGSNNREPCLSGCGRLSVPGFKRCIVCAVEKAGGRRESHIKADIKGSKKMVNGRLIEFKLPRGWIAKELLRVGFICAIEDVVMLLRDDGSGLGFSVDRIDSNGDYTPENCQLTTLRANLAKNNTTWELSEKIADNGEMHAIRRAAKEAERAGVTIDESESSHQVDPESTTDSQ